jgi:hypothetical protein
MRCIRTARVAVGHTARTVDGYTARVHIDDWLDDFGRVLRRVYGVRRTGNR